MSDSQQARSEPTPERLLLSEGYFEEPRRRGGIKLLTMQDDGLGRIFQDKIIGRIHYDAGQTFHRHWYLSGLAGHVPAMGVEPRFHVGGDHFGGMPRSKAERNHRILYREAVQAIGMINSRIVELVVCHGHRLEVIELGWPSARNQLLTGLNGLAKHFFGVDLTK